MPPSPGLERVPYFTNETVFENTELPRHLIIIGGGPIGLEMAQAHRALGSEVTVLEAFRILPKDDPELALMLRERLVGDGIAIREQVTIAGVEPEDAGVAGHGPAVHAAFRPQPPPRTRPPASFHLAPHRPPREQSR